MNILDQFFPSDDIPDDFADDHDPLSIEAWANSCCMAPHTGIVLAASTLAGVAGPLGQLPAKSSVTFPGINLAGRQSDSLLRMAVDGLARPLLSYEKALVSKSNEFSQDEIDNAMFTPQRQRTASDLTHLGDPGPMDRDLADYSPLSRLQGDLKISQQMILYERLVRSPFILTGNLPPSMPRALSYFHYGHGLMSGALETLPRQQSKRHQRLDELLRCFEGTNSNPSTSGKDKRARITPASVCLKGVVLFSSDDFTWLVDQRRDFLSRCLPIASLAPGVELAPVDEHRAVNFEQRFLKVAKLALASRRVHTPVITNFHREDAAKEFLTRQRAFLRELQEIPENLRVASAEGLPVTLAWALLLLVGSKVDGDDYVIDTAFTAARKIVEDARELFIGHDQRTLGETRLRNAHKLHKRLAQQGPIPRWELLRGLDQQSLQLHGPLIRALIELGIFSQLEDNRLHLGSVPLHKATAQTFIDLD